MHSQTSGLVSGVFQSCVSRAAGAWHLNFLLFLLCHVFFAASAASAEEAAATRITELPLSGGGKIVLRSQETHGTFKEELTCHHPASEPDAGSDAGSGSGNKLIKLWVTDPRTGSYGQHHATRLLAANRVGEQVLVLLERNHTLFELVSWQPGDARPTSGWSCESALLHQVAHARGGSITLKSASELELTYAPSQPPLRVKVATPLPDVRSSSQSQEPVLIAAVTPGVPEAVPTVKETQDVTHLALPLEEPVPGAGPPTWDSKVCRKLRLDNGLIFVVEHPGPPDQISASLVWLPDGGRPEVVARTSGARVTYGEETLFSGLRSFWSGFATDRQIALLRSTFLGTCEYECYTKTNRGWALTETALPHLGTFECARGFRFTGIYTFHIPGAPPHRFEVLKTPTPRGGTERLMARDGLLWDPLSMHTASAAVNVPREDLRRSGVGSHPLTDELSFSWGERVCVLRTQRNGSPIARLVMNPGSPGVTGLAGKDDILASGSWRFLAGHWRGDQLALIVVDAEGQAEYWCFSAAEKQHPRHLWQLTEEAKIDSLHLPQLLRARFTSIRQWSCLWEDGTQAQFEVIDLDSKEAVAPSTQRRIVRRAQLQSSEKP